MSPLKLRGGGGLAESLVALALAGIVMAAASRGLSQHLRLRRERDDQARADEIVRVVRDVLRAELDHSAPDIRLFGDTAVQLAASRVTAVACDLAPARLVLPASAEWWSTPRPGDSLAILDTLTGFEWRTAVVATATQHASARCASGGIRLLLAGPPPSTVPALRLPARVWRTVRYVSYRASDGDWWLGERSCISACGSAQPIAGPLLSPGQGGFRLRLVAVPGGRSVALDVSARTAVRGRSSAMASRLPLAERP